MSRRRGHSGVGGRALPPAFVCPLDSGRPCGAVHGAPQLPSCGAVWWGLGNSTPTLLAFPRELQNLVPQGCSLPESCPPSSSVPGSWSPGGLLGVCPTGTVALSPQRCLGAPARGESPPGGVRGAPAPAGCARVRPPRSGTAVHGGICCTRRGRWAASELSVCGGGCHRNPFPPERGGGRGRRLLVGRASGE